MSGETRELIRICEKLPQAQQAQVANYARSLLAGAGGEGRDKMPPRASLAGFAKGMIEMRDDFDEPLDEFAEYR